MTDEITPREKFSGLKFSQMKGEVKDSEGHTIGKLQDAIFKKVDTGFELTKFLVGGSLWEELMEDLGLREDIDPVFPISVIKGVSPKGMTLSVPKDELKSTSTDSDAINEGEFKLSELGKFKLIDTTGTVIGNIIDVTFSRNNFRFIVGDGFIRELAEDIGLLSDVDFLLENSFIEDFNVETKKIKLNKDKNSLKETFEKHIPVDGKKYDRQYEEVSKALYFPRSQF